MTEQPWWNARIDDLKLKMDWSDARVARRLKISPAMLGPRASWPAAVDYFRRAFGCWTRLATSTRVISCWRYLPVDLRDALKEWDNHRLPAGGPGEADNEGLPMPPTRPSPPDC
jgi:hypothetical protein